MFPWLFLQLLLDSEEGGVGLQLNFDHLGLLFEQSDASLHFTHFSIIFSFELFLHVRVSFILFECFSFESALHLPNFFLFFFL